MVARRAFGAVAVTGVAGLAGALTGPPAHATIPTLLTTTDAAIGAVANPAVTGSGGAHPAGADRAGSVLLAADAGRPPDADGPRTVRWTIAAGTHPSMMSDTARISDGLGAPAVGDVSPQAGGRPSVGAVAAQPARLVLDLADGSTPPSRWSPPAVPDDAAGYAALAVARVDEGDTTF